MPKGLLNAVTRDISFINRSVAPKRNPQDDTYGNPNYSADVRAWLSQTSPSEDDTSLPPNSMPSATSPFASEAAIAARNRHSKPTRPKLTSSLSHDYSVSVMRPSSSRRVSSDARRASYAAQSPISPTSGQPVSAYAQPQRTDLGRSNSSTARPSLQPRVSSSSEAERRTSYVSERSSDERRRASGEGRKGSGSRSGSGSSKEGRSERRKSGYGRDVEGYRSHVYRK